jgi:hypothetical protein
MLLTRGEERIETWFGARQEATVVDTDTQLARRINERDVHMYQRKINHTEPRIQGPQFAE